MVWYYRDGDGGSVGPLSQLEMRDRICAGSITAGDMAWRSGLDDWERADQLFPELFGGGYDGHGDARASGDRKVKGSGAVFTAVFDDTDARDFWLRVFGVLALGIGQFVAFMQADALDDMLAESVLYALSFGALAVSFAVVVALFWRYGRRLQRLSDGRVGGGYIATAVMVVVFMVAALGVYFGDLKHHFRAAAVVQSYDDYRLDYDDARRVLVFSGVIGPSMPADVRAAFARYPDIETFEITSDGGLIDDALEVAEFLEAQPGLRVVARDYCESACVPIFMAGAVRLADWGMNFGFHSEGDIFEAGFFGENIAFDDVDDYGHDDKPLTDGDLYLLRRGMPADIVAHGFSSGVEEMTYFSAIHLKERGVVHGLLDSDQSISLGEAKYRRLEELEDE